MGWVGGSSSSSSSRVMWVVVGGGGGGASLPLAPHIPALYCAVRTLRHSTS